MKASILGLALAALLLASGVASSQQDNRIYYGSRLGEHLTTVSKQGIGTANAIGRRLQHKRRAGPVAHQLGAREGTQLILVGAKRPLQG